MGKKRRVWTIDGMDFGFKIDSPESVKRAAEISLEKIPAMLQEGARTGVIVMVTDTEWSILNYEGYGKLCRKYGLRPGMFMGVTEA